MIQLNYRDARPIYEQVKDGFRHLIIQRVLTKDEKLPSVRELAATDHQSQYNTACLPGAGAGRICLYDSGKGELCSRCAGDRWTEKEGAIRFL